MPGATFIEDPEEFACLIDAAALATSGVRPPRAAPAEGAPGAAPVVAGALAMQGAADWQPYSTAVAEGPLPIMISLDYSQGGDAETLLEEVRGGARAVAKQTDLPILINVAAGSVAARGDSAWQALRALASCDGVASCGQITINPLHPSLAGGDDAESSAGYSGTPLVNDDWKPTNAFEAIRSVWADG